MASPEFEAGEEIFEIYHEEYGWIIEINEEYEDIKYGIILRSTGEIMAWVPEEDLVPMFNLNNEFINHSIFYE